MTLKVCFYALLLSPIFLSAQIKKPYAIFSDDGKSVSYKKMIEAISGADVVFFGEVHNNTLAHWLELQMLKDLQKNRPIVLGLEMFEADDQIVLDEYITGLIDDKTFLKEAKFWNNYHTDYKPLIDFSKNNDIPVIATNVPRRYANIVYKKGLAALDSIHPNARQWMAPLPLVVDYDLPGYRSMIEGMTHHGGGSPSDLIASQALKDATMAHFIKQNHDKDQLFFHVNGAYHSKDGEGIIYYLRRSDPSLNIISVHVAEQSSLNDLAEENLKKADFVICIVEDMIESY